MSHKKPSYILIFTLTILSLVTILTQQLLRTVYVGTHFDQAMIEREHAEMLALGGVNLAIAQLTSKIHTNKKDQKKTKEKKDPAFAKASAGREKKQRTKMLKRVLPNLNRWQVFDLQENIDGVEGQVKICVSCENGKININEAFDFKKKQFKPEYKKLLESLKFKKQQASGAQIVKQLTTFLKKRNRKLEEISLLQTQALKTVSQLFYKPPERTEKRRDSKPNEKLAIQDIFTIWSKSDKLEALFLSDALCAIFGFRRPRAFDSQTRKEKFETVIKSFDPNKDENNPDYWKTLHPLYEQKGSFKIEDFKIFSSKFEPTVYSVLSSGKVGNVEQKLLAIIEKESKKGEDSKQVNNLQIKPFKIIRLYWI
ncbi:hypothetical protein KAT92_02270 [Candidatus Babeliales bacterium]|nr:hypothetical protein [Candidatus Babeliales bacterium]